MKKRWKAHKEQGRLIVDDADGYSGYLQTLPDKDLAVTVERWRKKTSSPQLAYYYGAIVRPLCEFTGFALDEMDITLKNMFLSEYVEVNNWTIRKPISKTAVSTARFEQFLEDCRQWAASKLDVYLPLPNEVDLEETLCSSS